MILKTVHIIKIDCQVLGVLKKLLQKLKYCIEMKDNKCEDGSENGKDIIVGYC